MKKATIATVYSASNADTVGNANRIKRYQILAEHYNLIIFTNHPKFIKSKVNARVVGVKKWKVPFFSVYLFWLKIGIALLFTKYDLLFLVISDAPISFFNFKSPFLCHIQSAHAILGLNEKRSKSFISKKISLLYLNGVKQADHSLAISKQLVDYFISRKVDENKISYLPHGVDFEKFKLNGEHEKEDGKFRLIYTGWVCEIRGLNLMLEGLKEIVSEKKDIQLVIIGAEETYQRKIENWSRKNKLQGSIKVIGRVDHDEIPKYIHESNVCLSFLEDIPSYHLSPPQKLFEYFAMGKPVVANDLPTHSQYIKNGFNGYIIKDLDVNLFKDAIFKLYNQKESLGKMGAKIREDASQYDVQKVELELLSKVEELLYRQN
ncbi:glycosyltransferase [Marinifilum caeruleilacunae]|uniref:Glycosyltransferase n=1 Tax=Marinifilum caeruleilacunae TaxID=2499076 RepID=A0ABX1WQQ1_9BACT|nr:glycosyltransferase [Marinifilum caeruleilacunae]NOU58419.1 glycosyltransferase [Marinifilum caeruleilacunae]